MSSVCSPERRSCIHVTGTLLLSATLQADGVAKAPIQKQPSLQSARQPGRQHSHAVLATTVVANHRLEWTGRRKVLRSARACSTVTSRRPEERRERGVVERQSPSRMCLQCGLLPRPCTKVPSPHHGRLSDISGQIERAKHGKQANRPNL